MGSKNSMHVGHFVTGHEHPRSWRLAMFVTCVLLLLCSCAHTGGILKAAERGDVGAVKRLLDNGAKVDFTSDYFYGATPLHLSALGNHAGVVELLLRRGADPLALDMKYEATPLHWAAERGSVQAAELLLQNGCPVDTRDKLTGSTPLHWAVEYDMQALAAVLIRSGADVDAMSNEGGTALLLAVERDSIGSVELLIGAGADVNLCNSEGIAPLHWAAHGRPEIAKLLIENRADVDAVESTYGKTPLIQAAKYGFVEIVEMLVQAGASTSIKDAEGLTALEWAEREGHVGVVDRLAGR